MPVLSFSIVTVCRNAETTIARALESVAAQRHPDVRHLVIDGASTDATATVARARIRAGGSVRSEPDRGVYHAMNKGLESADGDVIAFLNADDCYADCDVLSDVAALLAQAPVDAVFGDVAFFRAGQPARDVRRYRSDRFRPDRLRWGWMPAHPGMFVRRELFARVGGFREDYRIAADFEFVARAFGDGAASFRHLPRIVVRMQEGGISTRDWRARMTINRETVRACRANGIYTTLPMVMSKYPLKLLERWF